METHEKNFGVGPEKFRPRADKPRTLHEPGIAPRSPMPLPLPARDERGEGWGEGLLLRFMVPMQAKKRMEALHQLCPGAWIPPLAPTARNLRWRPKIALRPPGETDCLISSQA